jgi:hypothetical protein
MRPVRQTKFYVEGVSRGNCQQAATASLLGLELDEVPNFMEQPEGFWQSFYAFLKRRGLYAFELGPNWAPDCYYLAYGPSSRGVSHAVVYRDGELAFDPHPSDEGIEEVKSITLIVPIEYPLPASTERL